jgi:hypothetical protein
MDGPWLDMAAYPNLPSEQAAEERVLETLRTVLRAPEVTPPSADAWDRAVQAAVVGRAPGHDHEAVAHDGAGHGADSHGTDSHGTDSHGTDSHGDDGHGDDGHFGAGVDEAGGAAADWQTGWPGPHEGGQPGGLVVGGTHEDGQPDTSHDPHEGGGHW